MFSGPKSLVGAHGVRAATKANNQMYPSYGRQSITFPLNAAPGRELPVSFWLPYFESCIDKREGFRKDESGQWGSGNHVLWGIDNTTDDLPKVGD